MSDFSSLLIAILVSGVLVFLMTTVYRSGKIRQIRKQSVRQSRSVIL